MAKDNIPENIIFTAARDVSEDTGKESLKVKAKSKTRKNFFKKSRDKSADKSPSSSAEPSFGLTGASSKDFSVSVRNTEPMLRVTERKAAGRMRIFFNYAASAAVLTAALALFALAADCASVVPFTLVAAVIFVGYSALWNKFGERVRTITIIVTIVALIAVLIILRKYIGSGFALMINSLYDMAEEAQAYIYDRFTVGSKGDNDPDLCMILATVWISVLAGLLAAIPGDRFRGLINTLIIIVTLIIFAYFGMIPSWIGAMVLVAAFLISVNRGRINSSWPLILAVMLVFGGIILLDPGENYSVSRVNENLRDRFAFHTSYIQGMEAPQEEPDQQEERSGIVSGIREFLNGDTTEESVTHLIIVIAIPLIIIAAIIYLIHRRLAARRKQVRMDIDSKDPNTAIGVMFPYTVKWLKPCGVDIAGAHFSDLTPEIREHTHSEYAGRYEDMLRLWMEAVYSDHKLSEDDRTDMSLFMKDTIAMSKKKADWKEKLRIRFKYAL